LTCSILTYHLDIDAQSETEREMNNLKRRRDKVEQDQNEVAAMKATLQNEISRYRELLEGLN
jgi:hypothetical protein